MVRTKLTFYTKNHFYSLQKTSLDTKFDMFERAYVPTAMPLGGRGRETAMTCAFRIGSGAEPRWGAGQSPAKKFCVFWGV